MDDDAGETPNERERYYDTEIAPRLLEIAKMCEAKSMPMIAAVLYDGEDAGLTQVRPTEPSPTWTLLKAAWSANGNIDAMCMSLARSVPEERDGSIALRVFRGKA